MADQGSKMYCVRCRKKQKCKKVKLEHDRRGKPRMHGSCSVCRTGCFQYVSAAKSKSMKKSKSAKKSKSKSKRKSPRKQVYYEQPMMYY